MIVGIAVDTTVDSNDASDVTSTSANVTAPTPRGIEAGRIGPGARRVGPSTGSA